MKQTGGGGGAGTYDALDAAEESVPGLGPRERRHLPDRAAPLAGGDRSSSVAVAVRVRRVCERERSECKAGGENRLWAL